MLQMYYDIIFSMLSRATERYIIPGVLIVESAYFSFIIENEVTLKLILR